MSSGRASNRSCRSADSGLLLNDISAHMHLIVGYQKENDNSLRYELENIISDLRTCRLELSQFNCVCVKFASSFADDCDKLLIKTLSFIFVQTRSYVANTKWTNKKKHRNVKWIHKYTWNFLPSPNQSLLLIRTPCQNQNSLLQFITLNWTNLNTFNWVHNKNRIDSFDDKESKRIHILGSIVLCVNGQAF